MDGSPNPCTSSHASSRTGRPVDRAWDTGPSPVRHEPKRQRAGHQFLQKEDLQLSNLRTSFYTSIWKSARLHVAILEENY